MAIAMPSLLGLPAPWLRQLTHQELGTKELVAMSQTCQTLQHEVLTSRNVTLTAPMHEPGAEHRHISLQRACQHAASVHLKLAGTAPEDEEELDSEGDEPAQQAGAPATNTQPHDPAHTARAYLAKAVTTLGPAPMAKVTQVTLQGMSLDALVPRWLRDACPQLTSLCLEDVTLTLPAQPTLPAYNTTLRHLTMPALPDSHSAEVNTQVAQVYGLQLEALMALRHLTLTGQLSRTFVHAMRQPLRQVTALHLPQQVDGYLTWLTILLSVSWPALTQLAMPQVTVEDTVMNTLLQGVPSLTQLSCRSLSLEEDYSQHPCSIKHLRISVLHVASTARLPLHSLESITLRTICDARRLACVIVMAEDAAEQDRVVAEVQRMGGLRWAVDSGSSSGVSDSVVMLQVDTANDRTLTDSQVAATCTLLSTYAAVLRNTALYMYAVHLTPSLLQQVAQVAQQQSPDDHMWALKLEAESADPAVWPQLLPLCRHWQSVSIDCYNLGLTEQQLTSMLSAVPRPALLLISVAAIQSADGQWQQRLLQAAQQAADTAYAEGGLAAVVPGVLSSAEARTCARVSCSVTAERGFAGVRVRCLTLPS